VRVVGFFCTGGVLGWRKKEKGRSTEKIIRASGSFGGKIIKPTGGRRRDQTRKVEMKREEIWRNRLRWRKKSGIEYFSVQLSGTRKVKRKAREGKKEQQSKSTET